MRTVTRRRRRKMKAIKKMAKRSKSSRRTTMEVSKDIPRAYQTMRLSCSSRCKE